MKVTAQRYEDLLTQLSRLILPTITNATFHLNLCNKEFIEQFAIEHKLKVHQRPNGTIFVPYYYSSNIEIYLWES